MSEDWSPAVAAVAHRVNVEIAQALHEGIADPAARDFAAAMVRIGYDLGKSEGELHAAFQRIARVPAEPEPPLLKPGTVVRIPGIDVPYVVDKGLATAGPHATLTFTTVDGRDWEDDRSEPVNAAIPLVNSAAEPTHPVKVSVVVEDSDGTVTTYTAADPQNVDVSVGRDALPDGDENGWAKFKPSPLAHFDVRVVAEDVEREVSAGPRPAWGLSFRDGTAYVDMPDKDVASVVVGGYRWVPAGSTPEPPAGTPVDADPNHVLTTTTAEAVLSETTEPYVSVNLSVTSDNSGEVLKVIREALRNGSLTIPTGALA